MENKKPTSVKNVSKIDEPDPNKDEGCDDELISNKRVIKTCLYKRSQILDRLDFSGQLDQLLLKHSKSTLETSPQNCHKIRTCSLLSKKDQKTTLDSKRWVLKMNSKMSSSSEKNEDKFVKEVFMEMEPNIYTRPYMEDFINVELIDIRGGKTNNVYVLCDGHNGEAAAKMIVENLPKIFEKYICIGKSIQEAIELSLPEMDKELREIQNDLDNSGSTCNLIYICKENGKKVIYSGNVGDSRSVLIRKDQPLRLSYDHKCKDKKEIKRVRKAKGLIIQGRFYGNLAVTRTMADFEVKDDTNGLICMPHVSRTELEDSDRYVIIASDGVWDVVNDKDVFQYVAEYEDMGNKKTVKMHLAKYLVKKALELGSRDNISCICLKF